MKIDRNYLSAAAFLFEQARGIEIGNHEKEVINSEGLKPSQVLSIANDIKEFVESNLVAGNDLLGAAIWALGKRADNSDVSFLENVLAKVIESDSGAAYQTMIALENAGINIFGGSSNLQDVEHNKEIGRNYLARNNA